MDRERLLPYDLVLVFHGIVWAYQRVINEVFGSSSEILLHPILENIEAICEKMGINLVEGSTIEEAFRNLSDRVVATGFVRELVMKKTSPSRYVLYVNGCKLDETKNIHEKLKPKNVTCLYALILTLPFGRFLGGKVKIAGTEFYEGGSKTEMILVAPMQKQNVTASESDTS